jgi:hypothetical protein
MPIKLENKMKYPTNWKQISKHIRFVRAGNKCEKCGAENYKPHPITGSKVILTVGHLDHNPENNDLKNLQAMCQRCHLNHDKNEHRQSRFFSKLKKLGQQLLFPVR